MSDGARVGRLRSRLDRGVGAALALLMGAAVLNVAWQVLSRMAPGLPGGFTDELARYLLVWIGLLGGAFALGRRQHVAVDLLPQRLDARVGAALALLAHGAVLAFALVVMVGGGAGLVALSLELGQRSAALRVSLAWVYLALPVSGAVIAAHALLFLLEDGRQLRGAGRT